LDRITKPLFELDLGDLRQAGGKGARLGCLIGAGLPVPPGFCVLARAYEDFIEKPRVRDGIEAIIASIDFSNLPAVEEGAGRIRELIRSVPLPTHVERDIISAFRELTSRAGAETLVAVRSSVATRDLALTSFPGQMDTYHNLKGTGEVLEKVLECWASAFNYSAVMGRHRSGIGHFDVFVAPVVQLMVDAESAGVIFTVNPLNGRTEDMAINACFGLGEGVVSGELECDHLVTDRETGRVLEERIGDKEFKVTLDKRRGKGNTRIALQPGEKSKPSLSRDQVLELVRTAREIEDLFSRPQDIEWAISGGKLFILQSRDIRGPEETAHTGAEPPREWICEFDTTVDPRYDEYTLSNISEVLPGVLTPLSISDIDSLDYGFIKCNSDLGLMKRIKPESEMTFLGIFYGRAHLNLSVVKTMVSQLPGANIKDFDRREAGDNGGDESSLWRPTPRNLFILPGILARLFYRAVTIPKEAVSFGEAYEGMLARARQTDCETASYALIFDIIAKSRERLFKAMALHITISQLAVTYFDFLGRITAKLSGDETGMMAARLVTGLQNLESAKPSEYIWDLSRLVADREGLRCIFENSEPGAILELLETDPSPEAAAFLERLEEFLELYGYRGIFEAEAMLPNWDEEPSYIFAAIKNYLHAGPESSPSRIAARQKREREEAVREAMSRLGGPQRALLRYLTKQAQTYISLREYMKSILIKGLTHGKKIYRILGRRLAAEGLLREPDDIYFLSNREIESLAMGKGEDLPVEELVARRRAEYERNLTVVLPEYSRGRPVPLTPRELEPRGDVETICGIGVSPGQVTGKARVITDPCRNAEIRPGEILVAPVTDAAWSPLFVTAAATVVDVGGPLSHGSIVAREFGIPCVVNASAATRIIHTGQVITVDGNVGKVFLHPVEK
jgi:phosphohistidine swiveling domain-containing protein